MHELNFAKIDVESFLQGAREFVPCWQACVQRVIQALRQRRGLLEWRLDAQLQPGPRWQQKASRRTVWWHVVALNQLHLRMAEVQSLCKCPQELVGHVLHLIYNQLCHLERSIYVIRSHGRAGRRLRWRTWRRRAWWRRRWRGGRQTVTGIGRGRCHRRRSRSTVRQRDGYLVYGARTSSSSAQVKICRGAQRVARVKPHRSRQCGIRGGDIAPEA